MFRYCTMCRAMTIVYPVAYTSEHCELSLFLSLSPSLSLYIHLGLAIIWNILVPGVCPHLVDRHYKSAKRRHSFENISQRARGNVVHAIMRLISFAPHARRFYTGVRNTHQWIVDIPHITEYKNPWSRLRERRLGCLRSRRA